MCDDESRNTRLDLLPDEWSRVRQCTECGACYRECDQVGRLACRVHPGVLIVYQRRPYFSCCGRDNESRGCLPIDHTTVCFARHPVERRLSDIQSFVTLALPRLYLQRHYIVQPQDTTIVFVAGNHRKTVHLEFTALLRAYTTHKANTLHAVEYNYLGDGGGEASVQSPSTTFSPSIEIPIDGILDTLDQLAARSPLLQYEMSHQEARAREIERECDSVWRDFGTDSKPIRRSAMPFVVIRRCGE